MSRSQELSPQSRTPVCILGAGVTGLSAAYHLQSPYRLFEAHDHIGGVASSFRVGQYRFDHAIHVLFTRDEYARTLLRHLLGADLVKHVRNAAVFSAGRFTRYPYQAHQRGLPADIIEENILGLIERDTVDPTNFDEWILATYGAGIARNFMTPYNRKVWATDLRAMSTDWIADRVPKVEIRDVLRSVLTEEPVEYGPNSEFWYPRVHGMQRLPDAFIEHGVKAECGRRVTSIDTSKRTATVQNVGVVRYDELISTLPIPVLIKQLVHAPGKLQRLASQLVYNRVVTVNIGAKRARTHGVHWVYVPDESVPFQRYSVPSNFSDDCAPPGAAVITTETSFDRRAPIDLNDLLRRTIASLDEMGVLRASDVVVAVPRVIDPAYVVPTLGAKEVVQELLHELRELGIQSCGRFGSWEYLNMDQSILSGKEAAERVESRTVNVYA
jgi:protoporphyrinogen oxidase